MNPGCHIKFICIFAYEHKKISMFLVKISSGELSGWGEAGQYGPPEPVASAIKARDQKQNYCLNEINF